MLYIKQLCANLDAVGGIATVPPEDREELMKHTPKPDESLFNLYDH